MAHHSRVRGASDPWLNILSSELASLDSLVASCLNGVDGGTYAPSAVITIGGHGLQVISNVTVARGGQLQSGNGLLQFTEPNMWAPSTVYVGAAQIIPIERNGFIYQAQGAGGTSGTTRPVFPLTVGATVVDGSVTWVNLGISGEFPALGPSHSGRTRPFLHSFAEARAVPDIMWRPRRDSSGMQSAAPMYQAWNNPGLLPSTLILPIRGVQGATISQITIGFRVGTPHTTLPQAMPSARLLRVDPNGNAVPCTSTASGADANGWVYATKPSSAAAWFNLGASQTFVLPCDQNNVVDRTQYFYQLEVQDEQWPAGSGWPWILNVMQPCALMDNSGLFPDQSRTTIDGVTVSSLTSPSGGQGVRILLANSFSMQENGIYTYSATAQNLQRSADLLNASQFGQGFVIGVQMGQNYSGSYWQASALASSWTPGTLPLSARPWQQLATYATGRTVMPLTYNGYWFTSGGGTAGSNEPQWPTSPGQTVQDGTIVWTCSGPAPTQLPFVTHPDTDSVSTGLAFTHMGNIFQAAQVEYTGITDTRWQ